MDILNNVFRFRGSIFSRLERTKQNKTNYIGDILDSIPSVDLIIVKDSETDKQIFEYTKEDDFFNDMVNIYKHPYYELKQFEKIY